MQIYPIREGSIWESIKHFSSLSLEEFLRRGKIAKEIMGSLKVQDAGDFPFVRP